MHPWHPKYSVKISRYLTENILFCFEIVFGHFLDAFLLHFWSLFLTFFWTLFHDPFEENVRKMLCPQ